MDVSWQEEACAEMWDAAAQSHPKTRYAVVHALKSDNVGAYLPDNYRVLTTHDADPFGRRVNVVIEGEDVAGWTLDDYVIPRLASGLMHCREHGSRNDAETAACAAMN